MFLRSSFPPQRSGMNRIEVSVILNLLCFTFLLALPACYRARVSDGRTQSVNNLKQIGLAMRLGGYRYGWDRLINKMRRS